MKYKIGFLTTSYFMSDKFKQALKELNDTCEITFMSSKGRILLIIYLIYTMSK
ncbi:hypothetical protein ACF1XE_000520 [Clostridioides difficile]